MRALLITSVLLCAVPALAQPKPDKEKAAKAAQLFEEGRVAYNLGKFDQAIEKWTLGYESKADPVFLYNIAQAHRQKGEVERAIFFYRSYLRDAPDAKNREDVKARITELEQIGKGQLETTPSTPASQPSEPESRPAAPPVVEEEVVARPRRSGGGLRVGGLALAGAGVVGLALGTYFLIDANGLAQEISDAAARHDPWSEALATKLSDRDSSATLATVGFVAGAVALAGGTALYYLGQRAGAEVEVTPAAGPDGASLVFSGVF